MAKMLLPPFAATVVLLLIGLFSLWADQPWLAPSLASAVLVQVFEPSQPSAKPWSIGLGQLSGLVGGFAGVYGANAASAPAFMSDHPLVLARLLAVALAVLITVALQLGIQAKNAAGGTIALLLALGVERPDWTSAWQLMVGIALVAILGEIARRLAMAAG